MDLEKQKSGGQSVRGPMAEKYGKEVDALVADAEKRGRGATIQHEEIEDIIESAREEGTPLIHRKRRNEIGDITASEEKADARYQLVVSRWKRRMLNEIGIEVRCISDVGYRLMTTGQVLVDRLYQRKAVRAVVTRKLNLNAAARDGNAMESDAATIMLSSIVALEEYASKTLKEERKQIRLHKAKRLEGPKEE